MAIPRQAGRMYVNGQYAPPSVPPTQVAAPIPRNTGIVPRQAGRMFIGGQFTPPLQAGQKPPQITRGTGVFQPAKVTGPWGDTSPPGAVLPDRGLPQRAQGNTNVQLQYAGPFAQHATTPVSQWTQGMHDSMNQSMSPEFNLGMANLAARRQAMESLAGKNIGTYESMGQPSHGYTGDIGNMMAQHQSQQMMNGLTPSQARLIQMQNTAPAATAPAAPIPRPGFVDEMKQGFAPGSYQMNTAMADRTSEATRNNISYGGTYQGTGASNPTTMAQKYKDLLALRAMRANPGMLNGPAGAQAIAATAPNPAMSSGQPWNVPLGTAQGGQGGPGISQSLSAASAFPNSTVGQSILAAYENGGLPSVARTLKQNWSSMSPQEQADTVNWFKQQQQLDPQNWGPGLQRGSSNNQFWANHGWTAGLPGIPLAIAAQHTLAHKDLMDLMGLNPSAQAAPQAPTVPIGQIPRPRLIP